MQLRKMHLLIVADQANNSLLQKQDLLKKMKAPREIKNERNFFIWTVINLYTLIIKYFANLVKKLRGL